MLLPAQEPRVPLPGQQLQGRLAPCLGHGAGTLREDPDRSHSVGHLREVGRRRTPLHLLSRQNRQSLEGQRCKCRCRGCKSGDFSKLKPVHRPDFNQTRFFFFSLAPGRPVQDSAGPRPLGEHAGPQHRLRPAHRSV